MTSMLTRLVLPHATHLSMHPLAHQTAPTRTSRWLLRVRLDVRAHSTLAPGHRRARSSRHRPATGRNSPPHASDRIRHAPADAYVVEIEAAIDVPTRQPLSREDERIVATAARVHEVRARRVRSARKQMQRAA